MNIKKSLAFASLTLSFITVSVNAQQYNFVANDNSVETKLCVMAASDNKAKFKMSMLANKFNKYKVINNLRCNDVSISKFAYKYAAANTLEYINRYSSDKNTAHPNVSIKDIAMRSKKDKSQPITVYISSAD